MVSQSKGLFLEFDHFNQGQRLEYRTYWSATSLCISPVAGITILVVGLRMSMLKRNALYVD